MELDVSACVTRGEADADLCPPPLLVRVLALWRSRSRGCPVSRHATVNGARHLRGDDNGEYMSSLARLESVTMDDTDAFLSCTDDLFLLLLLS